MSTSVKCICEQCSFLNECGYYEETMKSIIDGAKTMLFEDKFTTKIKDALDDFTCECFK